MLKKLIFMAGVWFCISGLAMAAETDLYEQINRAGEQRMLSQRIAKSFSQMGLNVQAFVAKQEMDEAIKRFEANLNYLSSLSDPESKAAYEQLKGVWGPYRSAATGVPQRATAIWLAHKSDDVLQAAEALVRHLQNSAGNATRANARLVAQAGRQRMLSQRIVKAYLLISWGDTSVVTREELDAAVSDFSGGLASLRQISGASGSVKREMEEMVQHWEWMQAALAAEGATTYRLIVAEAGDALLQSADRLTQLLASQR